MKSNATLTSENSTNLEQMSQITSIALAQSKADVDVQFWTKIESIHKLAKSYMEYLSLHQNNLSEEMAKYIVRMAISCMTLNLKVFKQTEKHRDMTVFRGQNPDFENLNYPSENQEVWQGIKTILYGSEYNSDREVFRETVLLYNDGSFIEGALDHLERFLPQEEESATLQQSIEIYIARNRGEISKWVSIDIENFKEYLIQLIGDCDGEISENNRLTTLDAEAASIKFEYLKSVIGKKVIFKDRAQKIRLIRDIRFGRVDVKVLKKEIIDRKKEITKHPEIDRIFGPLLRGKWNEFKQLLKETINDEPTTRMYKARATLEGYNTDALGGTVEQIMTRLGEYIK